MNELIKLSVLEMRDGLLTGNFSSVDLAKAHLEEIKATNSTYNSFLTVTEELALSQAAAADVKLSLQKSNSPILTGIPVAIKDQLVTEGVKTTCASKILKGFIPPYNCTAVKKLLDDGAVIVGKTNQDEFAMGSSSENSAFGVVRNPWDIESVPGGSSSGSAVAVAAGQAPLSLGTDTGGSIRQPASFTGIVGVKPTYGRVSRYGAVAFASSLDQIGPFGRCVEDAALCLRAIAGKDKRDSTSMEVPVHDYLHEIKKFDGHLKGLRIGLPKEYFIPGMDKEVEDSIRQSLKTYEKLGAEIVEISLPHTEYAIAVYYIVACAEASSNLARYDGVRYGYRYPEAQTLSEMYEKSRSLGFGAEVKRRIILGTYVLSAGYYDAYYKKAQQVRTLVINDFKAAFVNNCDVIATPVSPTTAFKIGEKTADPLQMYLGDVFTVPCSLAGLPGVSIPCGLDSKNLPIGLQLIGKPFSENALLKVAYSFGKETKFDTSKVIGRRF
ncbi:MAG: Asp-tRNA(Asn)/Glu-tRNA(Gln) amidotransferase subunit GatA [Deltaproteobacteria bacterium]|nr:Asp-tRNA(Asn)/Glu-tRNA(Gln) amidotransferase subunit GatA [Deltaproteobacteria bacterium]